MSKHDVEADGIYDVETGELLADLAGVTTEDFATRLTGIMWDWRPLRVVKNGHILIVQHEEEKA